MGVPQKWLVYKGKSHLEMDDLGVPLFQETSICHIYEMSKEIINDSYIKCIYAYVNAYAKLCILDSCILDPSENVRKT